jgi:hypothetical protein
VPDPTNQAENKIKSVDAKIAKKKESTQSKDWKLIVSQHFSLCSLCFLCALCVNAFELISFSDAAS